MNTKKGMIYISGGGNWHQTTIIDSHFLKNLPEKKILFIPTAKSTNSSGYLDSYNWLKNKLKKLSKDPINLIMEIDFNNCKQYNEIPAIYIGGGNVYKLLKLMDESNFTPFLLEYIDNGGIVYGASAGAVIMGKDISTYIESNTKHNYHKSEGLSLIGTHSILCHYEESNYGKVEEYIKRTNNSVIAIPTGTALIVNVNSVSVIGSDSIRIFETDGSQKKIAPNKAIN